MKVKKFIEILEKNKDKELLFQYAERNFAGANYHLTEVKNVFFDTTDCGGKTNNWKETHFQIWESPIEIEKTEFMKTDKFLSILNKVNQIKPIWIDTDLKIEYGNNKFPTSIMPVEKLEIEPNKVVVILYQEKTKCKAHDEVTIEEPAKACCSETACC